MIACMYTLELVCVVFLFSHGSNFAKAYSKACVLVLIFVPMCICVPESAVCSYRVRVCCTDEGQPARNS